MGKESRTPRGAVNDGPGPNVYEPRLLKKTAPAFPIGRAKR